MLLGIKVQEGVRICFDFIVDLQVFSGKWQEAGCVHGGPLNSFSTSPTHIKVCEEKACVRTPHHLLHHYLQSRQHTAVARKTAQPTTCWHLF